MASYLHGLLDFVAAHPNFAFAAVFLLALSEAIPVVGTVVPGSSLILGICALVTAADVKPWPLLAAAFLGAVMGDGVSFWLGHQYRREILRGWPLNRFPRLIAHSAAFIKKYGVASVFFARFTAVVRALVPLLAGIFRMSSGHFYFANVLSALLWAPLHVFPGIFVGMAIALGGVHAKQAGVLAIGAVMISAIVWSLLKARRRPARVAAIDTTGEPAAGQSPPERVWRVNE
jgi:membrane protein DedA with SNARE-associated domain